MSEATDAFSKSLGHWRAGSNREMEMAVRERMGAVEVRRGRYKEAVFQFQQAVQVCV